MNILALVDALEREMAECRNAPRFRRRSSVTRHESDGEEEDNRPPWEVASSSAEPAVYAWLSKKGRRSVLKRFICAASYHAAHDCSACALQLKEARARYAIKRRPRLRLTVRRFEDAGGAAPAGRRW